MPRISHMTNLLAALGIFDIRQLYYKLKLGYYFQLINNSLTGEILDFNFNKTQKINKSLAFKKSFNEIFHFVSMESNRDSLTFSKYNLNYTNTLTRHNPILNQV